MLSVAAVDLILALERTRLLQHNRLPISAERGGQAVRLAVHTDLQVGGAGFDRHVNGKRGRGLFADRQERERDEPDDNYLFQRNTPPPSLR